MRSFCRILGIGILTLSVGALPAQAQRTPEEIQREEYEYYKELESTEKQILQGESPFLIDWGGWNTSYYAHFEGYDPGSRKEVLKDLFYIDTRLWTKISFRYDRKDPNCPEQTFYLRVKNRESWELPGKPQYETPECDLGYVTLNIPHFSLLFGRQFLRVGRGISYQDINDGFQLLANIPKWRVKAIAAKTRFGEHNIDTSAPGGGKHNKRYFFGAEARYMGLLYHRPYAYVLVQHDAGHDKPWTDGQHFRYESQYYGYGSEGQLFLTDLRYWAEMAYETGHSFQSGSETQKPVRAMMTDTGVAYYFKFITHPEANFEYMYASGDGSRQSVTNTTSGNVCGADTNFLYFGTYPTGFATNFRLSNLHIFKVGMSAKPLEWLTWHRSFRDLTTGLNLYVYRKAKDGGVISDTDASYPSSEVGHELDFFVDWRLTADLTWSLKFGAFDTGRSFADNASGRDSNLKFLSTNLTLTF